MQWRKGTDRTADGHGDSVKFPSLPVSEFPSLRVSELPRFQVSNLQSFQVSNLRSFQVSKGGREGGRTNKIKIFFKQHLGYELRSINKSLHSVSQIDIIIQHSNFGKRILEKIQCCWTFRSHNFSQTKFDKEDLEQCDYLSEDQGQNEEDNVDNEGKVQSEQEMT